MKPFKKNGNVQCYKILREQYEVPPSQSQAMWQYKGSPPARKLHEQHLALQGAS